MGTTERLIRLSRRAAAAAAPLLSVAVLLAPGPVAAECMIVQVAPSFQVGEPNQALDYSFEVQDDGGGISCTSASGSLAVSSDTTGGASVSPQSFSNVAVGSNVPFTLTLGGTRSGVAEVAVNCPAGTCGNGQTLFYYGQVANDYDLEYVEPPDGTTQSTPNASEFYTVRLLTNGVAGQYEGAMCFDIVSNPAGDAQLVNPAASPKGFTCGSASAVATFADFTSGLSTIEVRVGSAATAPVEVIVYPAEDPAVTLVARFATTATFRSVTADPVGATVGVPFDVVVETVDIDGQPIAGSAIEFTANDPAITPSGASTSTDAAGRARASFTATQAGTFSQAIAAVYDPTPASPGSGDEQQLVFTVVATDVVTLTKPATGSGDGQQASPGQQFASDLVARAQGNIGPVPGQTIGWEVTAGSATLSAPSSVTDGSGEATVTVTAGPVEGPVRVRAFLATDPAQEVFYDLSVQSTEVLSIVSGQGQVLSLGATSDPLRVRLEADGVPKPGAMVAWTRTIGDATLSATSSVTDAAGEAAITVSAGSTPGEIRIFANSGGAVPAEFVLTASDAAADGSLRLVSGSGQRGAIGARADAPIVVEAFDGAGALLSGAVVGWQVVSGGVVLDAPQSVTASDGRAAIGFRFAASPGPATIRASLGPAASVDVVVETVSPVLSPASGDGQQAPAGTTLPQDLVVQVSLPAIPKSVGSVNVAWQVVEGGGQLESASTQTDAQGRTGNRLTLGPQPGTNRVRATVPGGASIEFTATATAAGSGELRIVSGGGQTLPTNSPSAPLVVELTDAQGQPIAGATIDWVGDNATPAAASTTTGSDGRSSNTARVTMPGGATVVARLRSDPDIEARFPLTGGVANTSGLGRDEETIAEAIDQLCPALASLPNPTPAQQDLLARCLELIEGSGDAPGDVADALDELIQDVALTQATAALVTAGAQFDNLKARIAALRSGSASGFGGLALQTADGMLPLSLTPAQEEAGEIGSDFSRWGFFMSGTIGRGEVAAGGQRPQYDFDSAGLTAGVDYRLSDSLIVGGALGWSSHDTDVAGDGGRVDTTGWSVSAYSTWYRPSSWYVDGVLSYGSNSYDIERRIAYSITSASGTTAIDQLAVADSDGSQVSAALSVGRDFQKGGWNLGPYLRTTWTRVSFDAYRERLDASLPGAGLGLAVDPRDVTSFTGVLGGKATYTLSRNWGILMPHVSLEWEHEFRDDAAQVTSWFLADPTQTRFTIEGTPIDSDYIHLGIGLSALFTGGRSVFIYYEHLLGNSDVDQGNLAIGGRFEF